MARRRRTAIEVQRVKASILKAALDLFDNNDYSQLSMRTIARKADCSVATIYNYYAGKDALYLDVLKSGFELLNKTLIAGDRHDHPDNNLKAISRRFFDFAVRYRHYYTLMFSRPLPEMPDGSRLEKFACKETAMHTLDALTVVIRDHMGRGEINFPGNPELLAKMFWAMSHGIISLCHSRILQEHDQNPEGVYTAVIDKFISCLEKNS